MNQKSKLRAQQNIRETVSNREAIQVTRASPTDRTCRWRPVTVLPENLV